MFTIFVDHGIMLIYHDGSANENSRFALSDDPVFNNLTYLWFKYAKVMGVQERTNLT